MGGLIRVLATGLAIVGLALVIHAGLAALAAGSGTATDTAKSTCAYCHR